MTMEIEVGGESFLNFLDASVDFSMTDFARVFNFTAASTNGEPLPFQVGDECKIKVDGEQILNGFIERMDIIYSSGDHTISVSGRDRVGDIVDSSLEKLEIQGEISFADVINAVLKQLNLTNIEVETLVTDLANFNLEVDKQSPSTGENAWDFLESLARKKEVLLRTNNQSNILIDRSPLGTSKGFAGGLNSTVLQNRLNDSTNNILSSSVSYDDTEVYSKYIVRSQSNISVIKSVLQSTKTTVSVLGESPPIGETLEGIRTSRILVLQAENASTNEDATLRAKWEANFREARRRVYTATINGFRDDKNKIWDVNQFIRIQDDFARINATMLIDGVSFIFDLTAGEETTLRLVQEGSYLPEPQIDTSQSNVGKSILKS